MVVVGAKQRGGKTETGRERHSMNILCKRTAEKKERDEKRRERIEGGRTGQIK